MGAGRSHDFIVIVALNRGIRLEAVCFQAIRLP